MLDAFGALGARSRARATRRCAQAAGAAAAVRGSAARQLAAVPAKDGDEPASPARSPTRPSDDAFPQRLAGLAAMLAAGLPLRCVALAAPGAYDTHANQAGRARRRTSS